MGLCYGRPSGAGPIERRTAVPGMGPAVTYSPPLEQAALRDRWAPGSQELRAATRLSAHGAATSATAAAEETAPPLQIDGPEDIILDPSDDSSIYTGTGDGRIMKVSLAEGRLTEFAFVGGRPLGGAFDAEGNLVVCEPVKGLLKVNRVTREMTLLATRVSPDSPLEPGTLIAFANDLDIAPDGSIYFSDSCRIPPLQQPDGTYSTKLAASCSFVEGAATGRLLRYDPTTRATHALATGLLFANGVVLSDDASFVLVAESFRCRVMKYDLSATGNAMMQMQPFCAPLPGCPDNISRGCDGTFWVAMPSRLKDFVVSSGAYPRLRAAYAQRHPSMHTLTPRGGDPAAVNFIIWAAVAQLSPSGDVLRFVCDTNPMGPGGCGLWGVSAAAERGGLLYLSSIYSNAIAIFNLSSLGPVAAQTELLTSASAEHLHPHIASQSGGASTPPAAAPPASAADVIASPNPAQAGPGEVVDPPGELEAAGCPAAERSVELQQPQASMLIFGQPRLANLMEHRAATKPVATIPAAPKAAPQGPLPWPVVAPRQGSPSSSPRAMMRRNAEAGSASELEMMAAAKSPAGTAA